MGMAPLAGWMSQSGYSIVGYDDNLFERVRRFLVHTGVELRDFLFPDQVQQYTTVVYSSAIRQNHPFLAAARAQGVATMRRGEMLARIASQKKLIAVVGSHGKTTTSGMVGHMIHQSGLDANYILGGMFNDPALPPSRVSPSEWLVAEVDESDGTIDHFEPEATVVLNIDWDHADLYTSEAQLDAAFARLIGRTRGQVLFPSESDLKKCFESIDGPERLTFGPGGDYVAVAASDGSVRLGGRFASKVLQPPPVGRFNQTNGAAAVSIIHMLGGALPEDGLSSFGGMARRQTVLHSNARLTVVEDYAHHPTEIEALLECLRTMAPGRRLAVVFQAHRYTRTKQFKSEFAKALSGADMLSLLPVYSAHESPIDGGRTEDLLRTFGADRPECLSMDWAGLRTLASKVGNEPTTVAFVGAGDIGLFAAVFASLIRTEFIVGQAWAHFLSDQVSAECVLKEDEPLANKTTMRVGGASRFYAEPGSLSDLRALLRAAKLFGLETFCLGRGSNLLVPDEGFDGLVIRLSSPAWRRTEVLADGRIWAGAGVRLKEVCGHAAKAGLSGFEFLEGIPGAVGGALRMNAGAMGNWMFDVVERVQMLDMDGKFYDLPKADFHFGYRKVEEISRGIALGAILKSPEVADESAIRGRMDTYATTRKSSQPRSPSAGCIFKNPEGNFAGKLIDQYGIKGMRVGAAEVSDVHGNFIVNRGGASAADVIELVRRVRTIIQEKSGYVLEPEVLLLGKSWDSVLGPVPTAKEGASHG